MKEFIVKNKIWIAVAAVIVIAAGILLFRLPGAKGAEGETAYVEKVENLTGSNASLGMINRFAGVVEPQGTWSVNKNADAEIKEIFVEEGDTVEEGDPLFEYSTVKYEEDLEQARIDLERSQNDYESTKDAIAQLEKEKRDASSSEQANYTIQIKEQQLALKDKELDIEIKEAEIEKLEDNIDNSVVGSGISGVVKKINESESLTGSGDDNSFITIMKVGNYRIKGTVNEQNIGELTTGAAVLVHSRVNERIWKGTITKIDTENAISSEGGGYMMSSGSEGTKSSKYPFYIELESSEGLILGQHVYVEPDLGQADENTEPGIWIASYMVDQSDPNKPFVWKEEHGRLKKQEVTIAETKEEVGRVRISDGLTEEDSICIPEETLREGMKTAPMSEKPEPEEEKEGAEGDEENIEYLDLEGAEEEDPSAQDESGIAGGVSGGSSEENSEGIIVEEIGN